VFDGNFREGIEKGLAPVGTTLRRVGLNADILTGTGIVMSIATAVAIGSGQLLLGVLLLALTGLCDALDGAVAKASGVSSTRGAFFDSVSDRLTDAILLFGVAWYLSPGRMALLPMAILGAAALVSYQRAKAESLGFDARGGLMERAERFIVLGAGLLFDSIFGGVLEPMLWVMLVLTAITAAQRFLKVWGQASKPQPLPVPARSRSAARRKARRSAKAARPAAKKRTPRS
jgi:CDP-diacylglycerol--glycerol-3-phosphate 3-phosphatidyltransferase